MHVTPVPEPVEQGRLAIHSLKFRHHFQVTVPQMPQSVPNRGMPGEKRALHSLILLVSLLQASAIPPPLLASMD